MEEQKPKPKFVPPLSGLKFTSAYEGVYVTAPHPGPSIRCPLCNSGASFTGHLDQVYQCACAAIRVNAVQAYDKVQEDLLRQYMLAVGKVVGSQFIGQKATPQTVSAVAQIFADAMVALGNGTFVQMEKHHSYSYTSYTPSTWEATIKWFGKPNLNQYYPVSGPSKEYQTPSFEQTAITKVPKESVKLEGLTPALQEFMKDFTE